MHAYAHGRQAPGSVWRRAGEMDRTCIHSLPRHAMSSYLRSPSLRLSRAVFSFRAKPRHAKQVATKTFARAAQRAAPQPRRVPSAADEFFAKQASSFASLGLEPSLCSALQAAGFEKPAHAQELAFPAILGRKDVVLAAETGSGKTLAYLAPLIQLVLANRAVTQAAAGSSQPTIGRDGRPARTHHTAALVLCPNAMLCEQVLAVARSLLDPATGLPLATSSLVSSASPPPAEMPHLVVSTPGALVSMMDNVGPAFGFAWTRAGLPLWARQVVFDEADLLMAGAYERPMRVIMDLLRLADRETRMRHVCLDVGMGEDEFRELPRHLKVAALTGGGKALLETGFRPASPSSASTAAAAAPSSSTEDGTASSALASPPSVSVSGAPGAVPGAPASSPLWRRQYVFVAATMPVEGGTTVGNQLERHFPSAVWLAGQRLHRGQTAVTHAWREVGAPGAPTRAAALKEVVSTDPLLSKGRGRMLVFTRDVASANATAAALRGAGPPVLLFHRDVPQALRAEALERMSCDEGCVMVCTDAAARGMDLPDGTRVVPAALGRGQVGRTARAGKSGHVTSLYTHDDADLVGVIREALDSGEPVEGAFSRKRSFRKKIKRYGQYVPRGQLGPQRGAVERR